MILRSQNGKIQFRHVILEIPAIISTFLRRVSDMFVSLCVSFISSTCKFQGEDFNVFNVLERRIILRSVLQVPFTNRRPMHGRTLEERHNFPGTGRCSVHICVKPIEGTSL